MRSIRRLLRLALQRKFVSTSYSIPADGMTCTATMHRRLSWRDCLGRSQPVPWPPKTHNNQMSGENPMARLKFGAFLAPHHPIGEHPMLQFRRDLDFVNQLDELGYDEFWCGEHHSSGWEMIASPEMFLAAAGERTKRIKLGTGVISLPYHHPFNVAQRMVQLDHM